MNNDPQEEILQKFNFVDCKKIGCESGWFPLIKLMLKNVEKQLTGINGSKFRIIGIKKVRGELRVYPLGLFPEVMTCIYRATVASRHTCEKCGKKGMKRISVAKVSILCDKCVDTKNNNALHSLFGHPDPNKKQTHLAPHTKAYGIMSEEESEALINDPDVLLLDYIDEGIDKLVEDYDNVENVNKEIDEAVVHLRESGKI